MTITEISHQFISGIQQTTALEFIAVIAGIVSVWYSRKENILVYPIGLINTSIFIYLSIKGHLFGEASVNFYYTIMSIYGWILWSKKNSSKQETILQISKSDKKEWINQIVFFLSFYVAIYFSLLWLKKAFAPEAIPWADVVAHPIAHLSLHPRRYCRRLRRLD